MSDVNSTAPASSGKPGKPRPTFPLRTRCRCTVQEEIRGVTHYFGTWDDPDAALKAYLAQKDALHAGRMLRPDPEVLTAFGKRRLVVDLVPDDFATLRDRPAKRGSPVRAKSGLKLFTAEEIRRMLGAAGQPLRAMILLGINCGFGNADCGRLPLAALDLDRGWVDSPRPKI